MSLTKDADKTTAIDNGSDVDTRNPLYALIGLNDFFLEQGKAVAERAQTRMDAYRDALLDTFTTLRADLDKAIADGRERATDLQKAWTSTDAHDLQAGLQEYVNNVVRSYASLAERGERLFHQVTQGLEQNPLIKRVTEVGQGVAKQIEEAADKAEERVRDTVAAVRDKASERLDDTAEQVLETAAKTEELAQKVADKAEQETIDVAVEKPAPARKPAPRKATARKSAPAKTAAKTADAKPAAKTPAKTAVKRAATKAPAKTTAAKPAVTKAAAKPAEAAVKPVDPVAPPVAAELDAKPVEAKPVDTKPVDTKAVAATPAASAKESAATQSDQAQ